jgi:hypothetical protein
MMTTLSSDDVDGLLIDRLYRRAFRKRYRNDPAMIRLRLAASFKFTGAR